MEFHAIKDAQALFDVNYFGLMRVTQKFLPLLRQSKGRIINGMDKTRRAMTTRPPPSSIPSTPPHTP